MRLLNTSFEQNLEYCNHSIMFFISHWSSIVYALRRWYFFIQWRTKKAKQRYQLYRLKAHSLSQNSHLNIPTVWPTIPTSQLFTDNYDQKKFPTSKWWLGRQTGLHVHNGIMLVNKKGQTTGRGDKRDGRASNTLCWEHEARLEMKHAMWFHSCATIWGAESRSLVARGWGGERGCLQRGSTRKSSGETELFSILIVVITQPYVFVKNQSVHQKDKIFKV